MPASLTISLTPIKAVVRLDGLKKMLRMYFVRQFYNLADEAVEDAIYDSQALRTFIGIDLTRENVPDATTLLKFRHWLEANDHTQAIFAHINLIDGFAGGCSVFSLI